jgi:hypothetical protein
VVQRPDVSRPARFISATFGPLVLSMSCQPEPDATMSGAWRCIFRIVSVGCVGGRTRTRTLDPLIKSQLLYQLSYAPTQGRAL